MVVFRIGFRVGCKAKQRAPLYIICNQGCGLLEFVGL